MNEGGDSYPCPTFKVPTSKPKGREYSFYIPSVLVIYIFHPEYFSRTS